jgi:biotin operon repressor
VTPENRAKTNAVILNFLASNKKPTWVTPLDVLIVVQLLFITDDNGQTRPSIEYLSSRCNVGRTACKDSINRLRQHGWIVKHSGRQGFTSSTYAVQIDWLPIMRCTARSIISVEAINLAVRYHSIIKTLPKITSKTGRQYSVRIEKGWQNHWAYVAQEWLDEGYLPEQINAVVDLAFSVIPDTAKRGMHTLKLPFEKLLRRTGITTISCDGLRPEAAICR